MKIHQVGGIGSDSNMYLLVDKTVALIDAGTGRCFGAVKQNLEDLGFKPSDVKLLINTHCHFDHIGGDYDFVKAGCKVAIHESEAELLEKGEQFVTMAQFFDEKLEPIKISRKLRDGDRIELGESILEVIHTPGHTFGSICLFEPKLGALFSGDTVFCGDVGRTDLPTSDTAALVNSIRKLSKLKVRDLYPGHGPTAEGDGSEQIAIALGISQSNW